MTVAALLTDARASHQLYRRLAARHPKPDGWQAHLWDALTRRQQADALDPQHTDPAWQADDHAALMAFYAVQLGENVIESGHK